MDIRCERCATEYELDDARVAAAGGVTIKCSTCGHVFKVVKTAPADDNSCQLRLFRGGAPMLATCPDPATLQQWIIESRVLRDDEISFGSGPWQHLWQVPELVPFFALLSTPPLSRGATVPGVPPVVAPPPLQAASVTGTNPFTPAGPISAPWAPVSAPPVPPAYPTMRMGQGPQESGDSAATVQVQITPEMFDALRSPPANHTAQAPAPWTPFSPTAPDGVPVPAPTIVAEPPVPLPGPSPRSSHAAMNSVPAPAARPALPPAPPPVRTALKTPAVARPKAPVRKPLDSDPEISAFVKRGRYIRFLVVTAIVLVAGASVVLYYQFGENGPSPIAKHEFEEGRKFYLLDTTKQFPLAEKELKKAAGKELGSYPEANGALAELYMAWAEHLLDRYNVISAEVKAKAEGGNTDEAKQLNRQLKDASAESKKMLDAAQEEINTLKDIQASSTAANRAGLDYARLMNDAKQANAAVETLKPQTDSETQAHVAAWLATDPAQRGTAETSLKDAIQKDPGFIRARWWLAQLHIAEGNTAAATADLQGLLKASPGHEWATEALGKLSEATSPTPETAAASSETKAGDHGGASEKGTPATSEKPDKHPSHRGGEESGSSSGPMDPDKLIDQAGRLLDKGKPAAALDIYNRVLSAKPTLTDALYGKGVALYNMGKTGDAITAFQKTLDVNPRFGDAMIGIAEAYKKNHDTKSAVKFYQRYLDVFPSGPQSAPARANIRALSPP